MVDVQTVDILDSIFWTGGSNIRYDLVIWDDNSISHMEKVLIMHK